MPLLFLTFHKNYDIPLSKVTFLVTINFGIQLLVDALSAGFIDKIGYRASMLIAHVFAAAGLAMLTFLPDMMPSPFAGILVSVTFYAVGGGLLEVLVSPVVEACPSDNKESTMSMLHSSYCWGFAGVVLVSTAFFRAFGIENWRVLALIWAAVPVCNGIAFLKVPIAPLIDGNEKGMSLKELFSMKIFRIFMIMMICAGASEQAVSQWASAFAEKGLGISKTAGDLAGPLMFALMQGTSRAFYGKYGGRIDLEKFMGCSCALCVLSYLGISFLPHPALNLAACAVCGLSVGIMWPGTFSKASAGLKRGGTLMFALLAFGGDVGCSLGPTVTGLVSGMRGDDLKLGVLAGTVFPALMLVCVFLCGKQNEK